MQGGTFCAASKNGNGAGGKELKMIRKIFRAGRDLGSDAEGHENSIKRRMISLLAKAGAKLTDAGKRFEKRFERPAAFIRRLQSRPLLFSVYNSFIIYLIVEMLSRRSPAAAVVYLFTEPAVFLYNWMLVFVTMLAAAFFRKRHFSFLLISGAWIILGIINCVLLGFRTTPLNYSDFKTFKDVMGILNFYISPWQIALCAIALILLALLLMMIFIRTPKETIKFKRTVAAFVSAVIVCGGATAFSVSSGLVETTFHNIQDAYRNYGFAYCFAASVMDRGIEKPDGYSEQYMNDILERIDADRGDNSSEITVSDRATEETPNIIFIQMESFFDVNHLKNVTFSEDPVPVFTKLKKEYSSGLLLTPSFGAGTANTEYEVNTGMPISSYGPGEYPYTSILRKCTTESVAYDLKEYGYAAHAIHDHTGKFYGRYLVYPNMGFDSFTSVEYMNGFERNPLNWVDDSCLTGEIHKALDSTEGQDYVFAVSVQGHGKYPEEQIDETQTITAQGFNEEEAVGFDYYINQLNRMDAFIGELIESLEGGEPTVVMIYGDHLPKFSFTPEDLDNGNIYETEYVIWDNFGLEKSDKYLSTTQLYSRVMELLDLHSGVITELHQYCSEDPDYQNDLVSLQYDLMYGKAYAYGGTDPFEKSDMRMGIDNVIVNDISAVGKYMYITGENLTERSIVYINGDEVKTYFRNPGRIMCKYGKKIEEGDTIDVIQQSSRKVKLSSAGIWEWHPDGSVKIREGNVNLSIDKVETNEEIEADIKEINAENE